MASIFTYDPDPPRISSPWLTSENANTPRRSPHDSTSPGLLSEYGVKKLRAEPQEGPTEYKLHLLLRPRRSYMSMSTIDVLNDSSQSARARDLHDATPPALSTPASSNQPRRERLKHLTTQLLWRLQQSSPYHSTSSKELIVPKLPEDNLDLKSSIKLEPLVPGIEESRGALYEIGVSDDGTLVGLTKDEMGESLITLRVMAASLGCTVEVVRMIIVGKCEWEEMTELADGEAQEAGAAIRHGTLWVAEALVMPDLGIRKTKCTGCDRAGSSLLETAETETTLPEPISLPSRGSSPTPQLRITLTGPTTSGKSSLLGTLSTGTLDNGRGKSRLSLLKHRHEMISGVTSSIAQELVGYKDDLILNFSQANIGSWVDIHDCAENGRLVFLSDSGGHPRFRRTLLRGLMNWAPHWSILCIAGDASEDDLTSVKVTSSARDFLSNSTAETHLVHAHLNLVLKLDVPMAIVITKLDLASKQSLQKTMTSLLDTIKAAGRVPKILQPDQVQHDDLRRIPATDLSKVENLVQSISESHTFTSHVPIVLTSAVKGTGMGLVHALLSKLPLPPAPTSRDYIGMALNPEQPSCLFHIDDTFSLPSSYCALATGFEVPAEQGVVVSGHVRFRSLSVGDKVVIGPFQPEDEDSLDFRVAMEDRLSPGSYGLSISHPSSSELARISMNNVVSASAIPGEWHKAQIVSIRNLRLPVLNLEAGQAGSVGVAFEPRPNAKSSAFTSSPRVRRGMVLAISPKHMLDTKLSLQAASGFTALFQEPTICSLTIGSFVNVYVASVRAAARVLRVSRHQLTHTSISGEYDDADDMFGLGSDIESVEDAKENPGKWCSEVSLELLHSREWIEMGSKVFILEGGSQHGSGLEGFVGKVVEIVD
ncbi:hypothetical protein C2857_000938 [Epichloe festucae Fl1]|uniref:Tr-type G domain-containing protein n=1 Tax=Epichloe festucae (strain Fl1) TaxID=877507 RepID=A0A7S9PV22_EPIFF|nr:hypothetical protein C2857_000938 [Epichloe festucae Fl1]